MSLEVPISLEPRYSVRVILASPTGGALELLQPQSAILAALQPILRGERGLQGPSGATSRRHAYTGSVDYCATAPAGSADSSPAWSITRITLGLDGTTTVAHATGAWTDRATLTYV